MSRKIHITNPNNIDRSMCGRPVFNGLLFYLHPKMNPITFRYWKRINQICKNCTAKYPGN